VVPKATLTVRASALVFLAFLPLAGCAEEPPTPPVLSAFSALYTPFGSAESGFELVLDPATPQVDRDLQDRAAYTLTVQHPLLPGQAGPYRSYASVDAGFSLVRSTSCVTDKDEGPGCVGQSLSWPDEDQPAPWGVGWTVAPPADAEVLDEGRVLVRGDVRYEYSDGRLAPSLITWAEPRADGPWGYRLAAYDVQGALGPADDWPAPPGPLGNQTRDYLVHPGEGEDFMGLGWTTRDAMDHLAADPQAGAILAGGGCVLHYSVTDIQVEPVVPANPVLDNGAGPWLSVWLQDPDGDSTRWSFRQGTDLLGMPTFSDPEGEEHWPFKGEVSCEERRQAPAPRLALAEAWARSKSLVANAEGRGYIMGVYHQPPDHGHGGFSPGNLGFEAQASSYPSDRNGMASGLQWDLQSGLLVDLLLMGEDAPGPA
jgi:hypothetical protein